MNARRDPDVAVCGAPVVGDEDVAHVLQCVAVKPAAGERDRRSTCGLFRIRQVQQMVLRELRVERDVEQAFLTGRMHARCAGDRPPLHDAVVNAPQAAVALGDEHVAVRQKCKTPGM
jgi:hypothetical protein